MDKHPEDVFLDHIANADKAVLTNRDGSSLSGLANLAATIYMEADYQSEASDPHWRGRYTKKMHTGMIALLMSIRG